MGGYISGERIKKLGEGNNVRGKWDKFICLGERK